MIKPNSQAPLEQLIQSQFLALILLVLQSEEVRNTLKETIFDVISSKPPDRKKGLI